MQFHGHYFYICSAKPFENVSESQLLQLVFKYHLKNLPSSIKETGLENFFQLFIRKLSRSGLDNFAQNSCHATGKYTFHKVLQFLALQVPSLLSR